MSGGDCVEEKIDRGKNVKRMENRGDVCVFVCRYGRRKREIRKQGG